MKAAYSEPFDGSEIYFHTPSPFSKDAFLYPICLGHFFCDGKYQVERNRYDSYLLMYIKRGKGYAEFADQRITFEEGQIVLISCYEAHRYGAIDNLEMYWLHFDGKSAKQYFRYITNETHWLFTLAAERNEIETVFRFMLECFSKESVIKEIQLGKCITDILTMVALNADETEQERTTTQVVDSSVFACEHAKTFMSQNFMEKLTVDDVAKQVSLSKYHFIRRFKKLFGVTPHRYLLNIRLDSASYFLQTTNRSVKDIALSCGFGCENHFCAAFKDWTGMRPGEFRQSKRR